MDILYLVDRLENLIASSRRMPLLNQVVLKEGDILNIVDQMRTSIPDEVKQARRIIQEKERIMAQAQAEASALLAKAREEADKAMSRENLLRAAEKRSQEMRQQAEEQVRELVRQAEQHSEQLKIDADGYVTETLRNLREHLMGVETEVDRWILSIEKGLESLSEPVSQENVDDEGLDPLYEDEGEDENDDPAPSRGHPSHPSHPIPRRASLANDTMGGPAYQ
ncbi:MAG TPA: hypothetical protein VFQ30_19320 [Ktedonobacteraceae bacterium]|nr:hypothetical protein [Ktedonobacteraceae bacterium]